MMSSSSVPTCRRGIRTLLSTGHLTINHTANLIGIPVRTLQRRLHAAGYTYTQLVDEVRIEEASRLLKVSNARMADVAAALGFTDPSNFSRAFLRWTGMSPKQYRRRFAVFSANGKSEYFRGGTK